MKGKMEPLTNQEKDTVLDSSPPPSLQELAVTKAMNEILKTSFQDSDFETLDPRLQRLLFSKLKSEVTRLQQVERSYTYLKEWLPHADAQLYTPAARERIQLYEDARDEEKVESSENGYVKKASCQEKWSYTTQDEVRKMSMIRNCPRIHWDPHDILFLPPDFEPVVENHEPGGLSRQTFLLKGLGRPNRLDAQISSQLLQYRLIVTFGMIPEGETDGYKSCWEVYLAHEDGVSYLYLDDYKGGACGSFSGTAEASSDALELLDFLCGNNIPHSYDGVLAGNVA